jgi:predicted TIM-barrel fold metal-dependent hydrolase
MERRSFLSTAAVVAATVPSLRPVRAATPATRGGGIIDTNVYLSHWAVRRSWAGSPSGLVEKLKHHGVTAAWVGSFESVLHTDIAGANSRLAEACAKNGDGFLRAFGTVNPTFPDWEDDLRRCHEVHRMPGIRVFPNYHGYTLDDPRFGKLLELASRRSMLVQVALSIEDDRSQNPVLVAPPVQPGPLPDAMQKVAGARVMLLNSGSRVLGASSPLLQRLIAARVHFEIGTLEGVAGIESLLRRALGIQLSFGSHSPYFYFEAALLKLQESDLTGEQLAAIMHGNAQAALAS